MAYMNGNEVFFAPSVNVTSGGVKDYAEIAIYNIGDIVRYDGLLYTPKKNNITGILPTDIDAWEDLTSGKVSSEEMKTALAEKVSKTEVEAVSKRVGKLEGMLIDYTEDSTEAYAKKVPTDAAQKAILNRVGGKTIQKGSKNICTDAVEGGIPFEGSSIGTIHSYSLPKGTYWILTKAEVEGKEQGSEWGLIFTIASNAVTNPVTLDEETAIDCEIAGNGELVGRLYPMIIEYTEGTEIPTEYEPYEAPSIEPTKVTEIISKGANLLDITKLLNSQLIDNGDGTYTFTKGAESNRFSKEIPFYIPANTTFASKVSTVKSTLSKSARFQFLDKNRKKSITPYLTSDTINKVDYDIYSFRLVLDDTESEGNYITFKFPMVCLGMSADSYQPYREPISYPIPTEIQSKEGYGYSVDNVCDEINFDSKKYVSRVVPLVLNGTEDWGIYAPYEGSVPCFEVKLSHTVLIAICSHYEKDGHLLGNSNKGFWVQEDSLYIRDSEYTTITEFKTHLAELASNGKPLTVVYELAEPTETDISDILAYTDDYKFIEVEGGGKIVAENENGTETPVPWTVTFAEV